MKQIYSYDSLYRAYIQYYLTGTPGDFIEDDIRAAEALAKFHLVHNRLVGRDLFINEMRTMGLETDPVSTDV